MTIVTKGMAAIVGAFIFAFLNPLAQAQESLSNQIESILEDSAVAGAGIVVVENGEPSIEVYWGQSDISAKTNVDPETLFRAGSISKNVTSLIALRLFERGIVDPDALLSEIAPEIKIRNLWSDDAPVRVIHLLEHTAGLPGSSYREYSENKPDASPSDYLQAVGEFETRWPPGTLYSYSNAGHTILARVLEIASGKDFDTLAREEVFGPLGMTDMSFATYGVDQNRLSASYTPSGQKEGTWEMVIRPSGSLVTTPRNLAKLVGVYSTSARNAPAGYLSEAAVTRMRGSETGETVKAGVSDGAYGLGTFAFIQAGHAFYGHWGKTEGFRANMGYLPNTGSGFVIMLNVVDESAAYQIREALATYLTRNMDQPESVETGQALSESVTGKAGHYVLATHNMPLRDWLFKALDQKMIEVGEDQLTVIGKGLTGGGSVIYKPAKGGGFAADDIPVATATFAEVEGQTFWIDRDAYVRVSAFEAGLRRLVLPAAVIVSLIAVLHGLVWGVMGLIGRGPSGLGMWTRSSLLASGLAFLITFALFAKYGLVGSWTDLAQIGQVSLISLTLAVTSSVAVLGALASFALVGWKTLSDRSLFLVYAWPASIVLSSLAVIWIMAGWAPLITWTW
ncbi:MAG: serine hydrolase domain-containing protein [Pseudomonadota bacterium]